MEAIATAERASPLGVEKRSDRSRAPLTLIARRPDGRIATTSAQPREKFIKTSKRKLAAARGAARGSDYGDGCRNQPIDELAASPQKVGARRNRGFRSGLSLLG
jgi:hypothetical protein